MIIANWKMNGSKELVKDWIDSVSQKIEIKNKKNCIFCPPTCYLDYAKTLINQSSKDIKLGSQELDSELSLPLTGGISSEMLLDLGCEFIIIGHSEQRIQFKETNKVLSDKLNKSVDKDLKPIFCVGESFEQKKSNKTKQIILEQLDAINSDLIDKCIVAYEPVWAIGTGEVADTSYIEEIHSFIKQELINKTNSKNYISVVYGGSVNLDNFKDIYSLSMVDGLLIGGASLDSSIFTEIYNRS